MNNSQNIPNGLSAVPVVTPEEMEQLRNFAVATAMQPCKKCGQKRIQAGQAMMPPRPSCKECVEKHLGAAMVLQSEIENGYDYRLRFIGHLHEAEEESREWSQLHTRIRQARKDYQKNSIMPNWFLLADLVSHIPVS